MELNKIYNENCLETMSRMPNFFVDLTITSPPYDNLRDYNGYSFDFEKIAKELFRVTKEEGVLVWIVGDATIDGSETGTSFKQALFLKEIGFRLHDTMIFEKNTFSNPSSNRYEQVFEYMFVFSKGKPKTFNPLIDRATTGKSSWGINKIRGKDGNFKELDRDMIIYPEYAKRFNIWRYKVSKNGQEDEIAYKHPAIFPEKLAKDHIFSWTNEGDLVYDCFGGSGTTAKVSIIMNRNYILSEISKEYCDLAEKRIEEYKKPNLFKII